MKAGPVTLANGTTDLRTWKCIIPGKKGVRNVLLVDLVDNVGEWQVPISYDFS